MLNALPAVCGIHPTDKYPIINKKAKAKAMIHNVMNVIDWIPTVSLITGIARTIFAAIQLREECARFSPSKGIKAIWSAEIFRGVVATIGLGILFLPFDLYYTKYPKG